MATPRVPSSTFVNQIAARVLSLEGAVGGGTAFSPIIVGEPTSPPFEPGQPFIFQPTLPVPEDESQLLYSPNQNTFYSRKEGSNFSENPNNPGVYDVETKYKYWEETFRKNIQAGYSHQRVDQAANPDGAIKFTLPHPTYFSNQPGVFYEGTRFASYGGGPIYVEIQGYASVEVMILLQTIVGGTADDYVEVTTELLQEDGTWLKLLGDDAVLGYGFAMPSGGKRTGTTCRVETGSLPSNGLVQGGLMRFSFSLVSTAPVSFTVADVLLNRYTI